MGLVAANPVGEARMMPGDAIGENAADLAGLQRLDSPDRAGTGMGAVRRIVSRILQSIRCPQIGLERLTGLADIMKAGHKICPCA